MTTPSAPNIILPSTPTPPPPPPAFSPTAVDQRTKRKSATPTFLGSATSPGQANAGWKTLIGT